MTIRYVYRWDESKRRENLRRHGFDFADAAAVFAGVTLTYVDDRFRYEEQRLVTLGVFGADVVSIVHTETRNSIRLISFRKATRREQASFFESFQN